MAPPSEIYIRATETDPTVRARTVIRQRHQQLRTKLAALTGPELSARRRDAVRPALLEFCTGELRHYLRAADEALYAPASGAPETRLLVRSLRAGLAALTQHIDHLATADPASTASIAQTVEAVLALHLTVEESVLAPALAALPGADLPALVSDFQILLGGGRLEHPTVIDVREIPPGQRHPRIFARYAHLTPGEGFTLVNNHDPKPLRREFEATHPDAFTWDYIEAGPEQWQVRIGRTGSDV